MKVYLVERPARDWCQDYAMVIIAEDKLHAERKENIIMSNIEAIEILKKDMDRIITLNNGGNIEKEFDLYQAEALAIQALENTK